MKKPKPPMILDAMVAVVLAYRPKPKTKPARKRRRKARKLLLETSTNASREQSFINPPKISSTS